MSDIAFLITNRYQIHHYRPIAAALPSAPTFVIETRDQDFGVDAAFIHDHLPDVPVETVANAELRDLDGRHRVIVCQSPVLPHLLLERSLVVAQQYSLAKEAYQYGAWRSLVSANLMYGNYSAAMVRGFCPVDVVGNPLFDDFFHDDAARRERGQPLRLLYLPTYGSLSSVPQVQPHLASMGCEVTIKLHHGSDPGILDPLPDNCTVVGPQASPIDLLRSVDAVLSDYSGAAFDALYAHKPLLLAGAADPRGEDFARLSDQDLARDHLAPLAATWDPLAPIDEQVEKASRKLDDTAHADFRDRFFANHGSAGPAAAAAIMAVLDHGDRAEFGHRQVRAAMTQLKQTEQRVRDLAVANARMRSRPARTTRRAARAIYHRIRPQLARVSPSLEQRLVDAVEAAPRVRDSLLRRLRRSG